MKSKVRRRVLSVLLAAAAVLALAVWGPRLWPKSTEKVILVVLKTTSNPYYVTMKLGVDREAATLPQGFRVEVREGKTEDDVEGQTEAIKSFLQARRLSALALAPASSDAMVPVVGQAKAAGARVVIVDTRLDEKAMKNAGVSIDAFVGSKNDDGGRLAAKRLLERLGAKAGNILLLEGVPTQETAIARASGFLSVTSTECPQWNIIRKTANWNREEARAVVDALLSGGIQLRGIFACNDEMALGALKSFDAAGVQPSALPPIVGFDATDEAVAEVRVGRLDATVRQQPELMGREAVRMAYELLAGQVVKRDNIIEVKLVRP